MDLLWLGNGNDRIDGRGETSIRMLTELMQVAELFQLVKEFGSELLVLGGE